MADIDGIIALKRARECSNDHPANTQMVDEQLVSRRAQIMGEAITQARIDALTEAADIAQQIAIQNMGVKRFEDRVMTAKLIRDRILGLRGGSEGR